MPRPKTVSQIKSNLLSPALTSHYEVTVDPPPGALKSWWARTGRQGKLNLQCAEASLPGSQLATSEITNNYHGVTERYVNRRIFDDRIDLTFYVDAGDYTAVRFFEAWMNYITNGSEMDRSSPSKSASNYFYRMAYPKDYVSPQGLSVIKFERDHNQSKVLQYQFINSYPLAITSMPISYDTSDLLKCTVSMTYIRYIVNSNFPVISATRTPRLSSIIDQANQNTFGLAGMVAERVGAALPRGATDVVGALSNFL